MKRKDAQPKKKSVAQQLEPWRYRGGLEFRVLVALLHAPEVLPKARRHLSPADFLTAAYAALAALLLNARLSARQLALARVAIAGRPYQPPADGFDWAGEARDGMRRLVERRQRWAREALEEAPAGKLEAKEASSA